MLPHADTARCATDCANTLPRWIPGFAPIAQDGAALQFAAYSLDETGVARVGSLEFAARALTFLPTGRCGRRR